MRRARPPDIFYPTGPYSLHRGPRGMQTAVIEAPPMPANLSRPFRKENFREYFCKNPV